MISPVLFAHCSFHKLWSFPRFLPFSFPSLPSLSSIASSLPSSQPTSFFLSPSLPSSFPPSLPTFLSTHKLFTSTKENHYEQEHFLSIADVSPLLDVTETKHIEINHLLVHLFLSLYVHATHVQMTAVTCNTCANDSSHTCNTCANDSSHMCNWQQSHAARCCLFLVVVNRLVLLQTRHSSASLTYSFTSLQSTS